MSRRWFRSTVKRTLTRVSARFAAAASSGRSKYTYKTDGLCSGSTTFIRAICLRIGMARNAISIRSSKSLCAKWRNTRAVVSSWRSGNRAMPRPVASQSKPMQVATAILTRFSEVGRDPPLRSHCATALRFTATCSASWAWVKEAERRAWRIRWASADMVCLVVGTGSSTCFRKITSIGWIMAKRIG